MNKVDPLSAEKVARLHSRQGFTLVELMVASVIMVFVIVLLSSIVSQVSAISVRADAQISSFQRSRFAFERMTRSLSQASLNPYWDYLDASGNRRQSGSNAINFTPALYGRMSDQHFCILPGSTFSSSDITWSCFFQAPIGYTTNDTSNTDTDLSSLNNLLNAVGFFVEFNSDINTNIRSINPGANTSLKFSTNAKWRYRLMEFIQPTDQLGVYTNTGTGWVTNAMIASSGTRAARPIADNIIALILQAKKGDGSFLNTTTNSYLYDSRYKPNSTNLPVTYSQLPPQVQITMVAIDEASASRLQIKYGTNTPPPLVNIGYFQDPASFTQDLGNLETDLQTNAARINYRIFNTTVRLESAKWSD